MRTFKSRLLQAVEALAEAEKLELIITFTASSRRDATIMHVMVPGTWRTVARLRLVLDEVGFELHVARLSEEGTFSPVVPNSTVRYQDQDGIEAALRCVAEGLLP